MNLEWIFEYGWIIAIMFMLMWAGFVVWAIVRVVLWLTAL